MAVQGAAARPSRRFLLVSGVVLAAAVAVVLLLNGGWSGHRKDPEPPDVWQREGGTDDLRLAPDGALLVGWFLEVEGDSSSSSPDTPPEHYLLLGIEGRQQRTKVREFVDIRIRNDPGKWQRERGDRFLLREGGPVDTPSGRWWRYSTRWWRGATPPKATPR